MALIPFNHPNIDRIIERDYEAYVDRLWDEAYGDHGERCKNCEHFNAAYKNDPAFCDKHNKCDEIEDDAEYEQFVKDNAVDPEDCCDDWEFNESLADDEPEDDY